MSRRTRHIHQGARTGGVISLLRHWIATALYRPERHYMRGGQRPQG